MTTKVMYTPVSDMSDMLPVKFEKNPILCLHEQQTMSRSPRAQSDASREHFR